MLKIAIRIFEKIKREISGYVELSYLNITIEEWRFEFSRNDVKRESEQSLIDNLLHRFDQIKLMIQSKNGSNSFRDYLIDKFDVLISKFVVSPASLSFLLAQRSDFVVILLSSLDWSRTLENFKIFYSAQSDLNRNRKDVIDDAIREIWNWIYQRRPKNLPIGTPILISGLEVYIETDFF